MRKDFPTSTEQILEQIAALQAQVADLSAKVGEVLEAVRPRHDFVEVEKPSPQALETFRKLWKDAQQPVVTGHAGKDGGSSAGSGGGGLLGRAPVMRRATPPTINRNVLEALVTTGLKTPGELEEALRKAARENKAR